MQSACICLITSPSYFSRALAAIKQIRKFTDTDVRLGVWAEDFSGTAAFHNYKNVTLIHKKDLENGSHGSELADILAARPIMMFNALKKYECVLFMGADQMFYSNPDMLLSYLRDFDFVGVPHVYQIPKDHRVALHTYMTGLLNTDLQLWARSDSTMAFLERYANELYAECVDSPRDGRFFDQIWLQYALFVIPRAILLRDPTYNVAYFNLHEQERQEILHNKRVRSFQFSGYDERTPAKLSKYISDPKTISLNATYMAIKYHEKLMDAEMELILEDMACRK